ncbi:MAG: hypothetical protein IJF90_08870 [Synergistaceae bacterium]|nr:hypothetical protein [Synergistaceae bacterium]
MPNKLLTALIAALVGAGGFILGALSRQPEINDLHKQVKRLQKKIEDLNRVVNEQNDEIAELIARYQALKFYQIFQKSELKAQLQESIAFQYATADYFNMLLEHLDSKEEFDGNEAEFYYAFSLMLAGGNLSDEQKETIKRYVTFNHGSEIKALIPCELEVVLEELADYGKKKKSSDKDPWFKFPSIEPPNILNPFKKTGMDEEASEEDSS